MTAPGPGLRPKSKAPVDTRCRGTPVLSSTTGVSSRSRQTESPPGAVWPESWVRPGPPERPTLDSLIVQGLFVDVYPPTEELLRGPTSLPGVRVSPTSLTHVPETTVPFVPPLRRRVSTGSRVRVLRSVQEVRSQTGVVHVHLPEVGETEEEKEEGNRQPPVVVPGTEGREGSGQIQGQPPVWSSSCVTELRGETPLGREPNVSLLGVVLVGLCVVVFHP